MLTIDKLAYRNKLFSINLSVIEVITLQNLALIQSANPWIVNKILFSVLFCYKFQTPHSEEVKPLPWTEHSRNGSQVKHESLYSHSQLSKPNYQKQVQNPIIPGQCALHEAVKRLPRFSPVLCFPFRRIGADRMGYLVPSFVLQKQRIKN